MASLDDAIDQMLANGMPAFPAGHPRIGERIVRYGPKKKAWYRLYEFRTRAGEYVVGGAYGIWSGVDPQTFRIEIDWKGISEDARRAHAEARAKAGADEAVRTRERASRAAGRAHFQWHAGHKTPPEGVRTYLDRKGVKAVRGLRFEADGTLLVPMIRYDVKIDDPEQRRLVGLQKIAPDGAKRFNAGMAKDGAACRLGPAPKAGEPVFIAEGVATALSLLEATEGQHGVYVAFDAGNLLKAAPIIRALHPKSPVIFAADDDAYVAAQLNSLLAGAYGVRDQVTLPLTNAVLQGEAGAVTVNAELVADGNGVEGVVGSIAHAGQVRPFSRINAGRVYAQRAADAIGNASVVYPVFASRLLSADPAAARLTDFNDLHAAEGVAAVRQQLDADLKRLAFAREVRAAVKAEISGEQKRKRGEGGPGEPPDTGPGFDWSSFHKRFTLIYPTETAYDAHHAQIVKLSAMRVAFGEQVVKFWLRSPTRRMVNADRVLFDPSREHIDGAVNLFRGLPMRPDESKQCTKLLELAQFLCGEEDQDQTPATDWLLNWMAYPLQHPGAKMRTAVVMHGAAEGTGKNLLWGAYARIFGEYGALINQFQLQSQFNDWASCKMFVVANEVITAMERRHLVGYLKTLVTEPRIPIEAKNMPVREEDNHMNLVFLSNELRPLHIAPGDRRYFVVRTPAGKPADYYLAVEEEIQAGGAEGLYAALLARDLGDFNEHTRPPHTEAKDTLTELSLTSAQAFWHDLHAGDLPLDYKPCISEHLYAAYEIWCRRTGEKYPRKLSEFSQEFMSMNGVRRRRGVRLADPNQPARGMRQRTLFLLGESDLQGDALADAVWQWRDALKSYAQDSPFRGGARAMSGDDEPF